LKGGDSKIIPNFTILAYIDPVRNALNNTTEIKRKIQGHIVISNGVDKLVKW